MYLIHTILSHISPPIWVSFYVYLFPFFFFTFLHFSFCVCIFVFLLSRSHNHVCSWLCNLIICFRNSESRNFYISSHFIFHFVVVRFLSSSLKTIYSHLQEVSVGNQSPTTLREKLLTRNYFSKFFLFLLFFSLFCSWL